MTTTTLPITNQAAEYDDNHRNTIHIARSKIVPTGRAWCYWYNNNTEDFANLPEHELGHFIETELLAFDDHRDHPEHIEITLPRN